MSRSLVVVSGGSGGIGSALSRKLSKAGFCPVITYNRDEHGATALAHELGGLAVYLDLSCSKTIVKFFETLAGQEYPVAGLVLAASPPPGLYTVGNCPEEELRRQIDVNVIGHFLLASRVITHLMAPHRKGFLVTILSSALGNGGLTAKRMAAYIIAKSGLKGLADSVASDYPWLSVHQEYPTYTETPMLEVFDHRFVDLLRRNGRIESPNQVADRILDFINVRMPIKGS